MVATGSRLSPLAVRSVPPLMVVEPPEYVFKIKGVEVGRARIRMNQYLAINPGTVEEEIPGEPTTDPAFGLPAIWIGEEERERAERLGYTVVDPPSIIATHLTEIIKRHVKVGGDLLAYLMAHKHLD